MRLFCAASLAAILAMPKPSLGQALPTFGPDPQPRIVFDVNVFSTANSPAHTRNFTSTFITFGEAARTNAEYSKPPGVSSMPFDLGASYMLVRWLGAGYSHGRTTYELTPIVAATIPHPVFLQSPATGTGTTGHEFSRHETENRLYLILAPYRSNRFEARVFGGPSFFSYSAQMIKTVSYAQAYSATTPQSSITITGSTDAKASGSAVGFAAGADFAYFPLRHVGFSVGYRISEANVQIDEPLSGLRQEVLVGSNVVFVGVRFRFRQ